ncbi:carbamoyltransferase HypF [Ruminococcus bicirculans (ex Wegman et al. 2014)]|uniref:carbamoyltransferase HypF n=1 Tax=Ruminococcus bicirculans (ex Wegman et al. 2014) TaxID=1160721 RepID=UPI000E4A6B00|nr:carbamoyltransferase HypF [Ruminococcus sp. AF19-15]
MKTEMIRVYGIVQGVGFRPFVSREASDLGLCGTVANKGSYVEIHAQGSEKAVEELKKALENRPPERSVIMEIISARADEPPFDSFEIIDSEKEKGDIFVSPDIAVCEKCKGELFDKTNRRYLHPFINCTQCGPRLTIMDSMPYDRVRTTMADFPMCKDCEEEYTDPATRRYDAQPVCCNECGPEVYIIGSEKKGAEAITATREAVMAGKIIAVKGIGGFHLCCDAKNESAVKRLRELKNRPAKPLAVMLKDISAVRRECDFGEVQEKLLTGWQKPIVLLDKKTSGSLCESVAPDNPTVGVMLPYAPLHLLLFDYDDGVEMTDSLVMTSGNVRGAPICRNDEDALSEIAGFCDLILSHNRRILIRSDDTVMDTFEGKPYIIRRSRGYAPLPVMTSCSDKGQTLAIGGELKNTFCIRKGSLYYLSSYVGDMADIRTVKALEESVKRMCELLEATPQNVVCDMHPKYNTVAFAEGLDLPLKKVQHHYAHILSCMAENDYSEKVIGVSYDGTGFGTDGTIWGGEILLCDRTGFERMGSIKPFMQVGGDLSSKEGWRIATMIAGSAYGESGGEICEKLGICTAKEYKLLSIMAEKKVNAVSSTSAGRLFDAASAVLGIRRFSTFEGEASMALQFAAEKFSREPFGIYEPMEKLTAEKEGRIMLCTQALIKRLCQGMQNGEDKNRLSYEFHSLLADMTAQACRTISERTGVKVCALSGGVFQNKLLLKMVKCRLEKMGLRVLIHSLVPANDGGIALGQAFYLNEE